MEQQSIGPFGKFHFKHEFLKVIIFLYIYLQETNNIATISRELTSRKTNVAKENDLTIFISYVRINLIRMKTKMKIWKLHEIRVFIMFK